METEFIWQAGRNFQRMSAFLLSSGKVIKMRIFERERGGGRGEISKRERKIRTK